ncbi:MAG: ABC transporter permease [Bacillota bacterium]
MPFGRDERCDGWAETGGGAAVASGAGSEVVVGGGVLPSGNPVVRAVRAVVEFVRQVLAVAEAEMRKLRHDPVELLTRAVQPTLWLVVFGQVMSRVRAIPTGRMSYLDFMAPGILAQSVLFIAIFYGISLIWERDLGVLHKYLVSPAYRGALVSGKAVSAGIRALTQAIIVYLLAWVMGVRLQLTLGAIGGVLLSILLGAAIFSTFSLVVACLVKTRERFMGIGQVLTMPLFFASNAIYPLSIMPEWLKLISHVNPLTYQVDALRALMIQGGHAAVGLGVDFAVQAAVLLVLIWIAARLYPDAIN